MLHNLTRSQEEILAFASVYAIFGKMPKDWKVNSVTNDGITFNKYSWRTNDGVAHAIVCPRQKFYQGVYTGPALAEYAYMRENHMDDGLIIMVHNEGPCPGIYWEEVSELTGYTLCSVIHTVTWKIEDWNFCPLLVNSSLSDSHQKADWEIVRIPKNWGQIRGPWDRPVTDSPTVHFRLKSGETLPINIHSLHSFWNMCLVLRHWSDKRGSNSEPWSVIMETAVNSRYSDYARVLHEHGCFEKNEVGPWATPNTWGLPAPSRELVDVRIDMAALRQLLPSDSVWYQTTANSVHDFLDRVFEEVFILNDEPDDEEMMEMQIQQSILHFREDFESDEAFREVAKRAIAALDLD